MQLSRLCYSPNRLGICICAFLALLLSGCGGGGEGGGASTPPNIGWISVDSSSVAQANGGISTASVSGSAFVSQSYTGFKQYGTCLLLCLYDDGYPGVDVTWENRTLGSSGVASSRFGTLTSWKHFWSASVPVRAGSNTITIRAHDPAGNSTSTTLTVQYTDSTSPTITAISPTDGSTAVGTNSQFAVYFSEEMDPASISTSTISLKDSLNVSVTGTVGISNLGTTAMFTPSGNLLPSTLYSATVSMNVKDVGGNALASTYTWSFSTAAAPDTTPPIVTSSSPVGGTNCVSTETGISAQFSESVLGGTVNTGTFLLKDSVNNAIAGVVSFDSLFGGAAFQPNGMLANATDFTATLTTGLTDLAGNHLVSDYTWTFTTAAEGSGTWRDATLNFAPSRRTEHTAVWTGTEMIVWGGEDGISDFGDGARYNPVTDQWTPLSSVGAPLARRAHLAVWTGNKMIVWGGTSRGSGILTNGAVYEPSTDTWTPVSLSGAPSARALATAVWTGTEMIVWGGLGGLNSGARYNPVTDTWAPVSSVNAPSARYNHAASWTGSEMIIWGGGQTFPVSSGGVYSPASDTWVATSLIDAPYPRDLPVTVWTGSELFVLGGARFNPSTNSWRPISLACGAQTGGFARAAMWSGTEVIVPGGGGYTVGGRYNPISDSWQLLPMAGAPSKPYGNTAIWTGTEMIVWGGTSAGSNTAAIFRPQ